MKIRIQNLLLTRVELKMALVVILREEIHRPETREASHRAVIPVTMDYRRRSPKGRRRCLVEIPVNLIGRMASAASAMRGVSTTLMARGVKIFITWSLVRHSGNKDPVPITKLPKFREVRRSI
jgi:hypothetical protein